MSATQPLPVRPILDALPAPAPSRRRRRLWPWLVGGCGLAALFAGGLVVLALVLLVGWGLSRLTPDAPGYRDQDAAVRTSWTGFNSDGKQIAVELFEPAVPGRRPAVVVVHGADGLQQPNWHKVYHGQAQELTRSGYVAALVHYFDATGTPAANAKVIQQHFLTWAHTLADAVTWTSQLPNVEGEHVGLVGTSLGASLAVSLAAFDPRVGAVVEYFGGLPPEVAAKLTRMPPVLILHGDRDRVVPVAEARKLEQALADKGLPFEAQVYPGQGHGFQGAAANDALRRTVGFFDRHLKKDKAAPK
jgi:carboxymethylenebutenolidase